MERTDAEDVRELWNRIARDWRAQVGEDGDANRRLNSDPILWSFLPDVRELAVLDVGCGTGYLAQKLHERGAIVTGVDVSDEMIRISRQVCPSGTFRVDSASHLGTCVEDSFDVLVSNYVLMDLPDLDGAIQAFHRVLKDGGTAVVVFSHPCFPQGRASVHEGDRIAYTWDFPYFERRRCTDPPWGHFTSDFIWFHRPLSDYWKAFRAAGFEVAEFEEPRITPERYHLAGSPERLRSSRTRPYSVAFKLRKP